tara:strand:- start:28 stop:696 length:669 start_codon:yes stop_codon:yes gene_type:complete
VATINQRIEELIGTDYNTIPANSLQDLTNAAVNEIADSLPPELLLKYVANSSTVNSSAGMDATEEKKVLLVTREISNSGTEVRECTPVPFYEFLRAQDSTSIYTATVESPVYTYDVTTANDPKLKIFPVPTGDQIVTIWHFNYKTGATGDGSTVSGLPDSVLQAIVLKSCVNILQTYISDFVQDEEDNEMQTMLTAQIQTLTQQYGMEMSRFMEQDATPRGE